MADYRQKIFTETMGHVATLLVDGAEYDGCPLGEGKGFTITSAERSGTAKNPWKISEEIERWEVKFTVEKSIKGEDVEAQLLEIMRGMCIECYVVDIV